MSLVKGCVKADKVNWKNFLGIFVEVQNSLVFFYGFNYIKLSRHPIYNHKFVRLNEFIFDKFR